jgi:hypothetical protein
LLTCLRQALPARISSYTVLLSSALHDGSPTNQLRFSHDCTFSGSICTVEDCYDASAQSQEQNDREASTDGDLVVRRHFRLKMA